MGTIYKRNKCWYINVMAEGRRIRRRVGRSKKVAELALMDIEVNIARRRFNLHVPDSTIDEVFKAYLKYSTTNHAASTVLRYRQIMNYPSSRTISPTAGRLGLVLAVTRKEIDGGLGK